MKGAESMKISELTADMVKDYCGISDEDSDDIIGTLLMPAAKAFIMGHTSQSSFSLCETFILLSHAVTNEGR